MPSFRLIFAVHGMKPSHAPEAVMDMAVAVTASHGFVEAKDLKVVSRGGVPTPEIVLRFTLEGEGLQGESFAQRAHQVADDVATALEPIAITGAYRVLARAKGRWDPV